MGSTRFFLQLLLCNDLVLCIFDTFYMTQDAAMKSIFYLRPVYFGKGDLFKSYVAYFRVFISSRTLIQFPWSLKEGFYQLRVKIKSLLRVSKIKFLIFESHRTIHHLQHSTSKYTCNPPLNWSNAELFYMASDWSDKTIIGQHWHWYRLLFETTYLFNNLLSWWKATKVNSLSDD